MTFTVSHSLIGWIIIGLLAGWLVRWLLGAASVLPGPAELVAWLRSQGAAVRALAGDRRARLDGTLAVRFRDGYVRIEECQGREKSALKQASAPKTRKSHPGPSAAYRRSMARLLRSSGPPLWAAAGIDRTRTSDRLD